MPFSADALAEALLDARRTGRRLPVSTEPPPGDAEAFAVQDLVTAATGPVGAWKCGAATPDGIPFGGPIFAADLYGAAERFPAGRFSRIGIEVELAVRLAKDLDGQAGEPSPEAVRDAIGTVHAAIEIIDSRFDGWPLPDPRLGLADHGNNGALMVVAEGRPYRGQDVSQGLVTLSVDGAVRHEGIGRNTGGDALRPLAWLAVRAVRLGGLKAGTVVTLGSLNTPVFVDAPTTVEAEVAGVGRLSATFA